MGRSAYDFDRYASIHLRRYLKYFELPTPPDCDPRDILLTLPRTENQSTSNAQVTSNVHEPWRLLEWINPIVLSAGYMSTYLDTSIPMLLNSTISQSDPIYALPSVLSSKFYAHRPCNIEEMMSWLTLPLVTATRVVHNAFPESQPSAFDYSHSNAFGPDRSKFHYLLWKPRYQNNATDRSGGGIEGRLVVAFQTPFDLSERDLCEFRESTTLPPKSTPYDSMPRPCKLWAKIWETCHANHAQYFVLTSYTHWVFGVFSDSHRTAFVTPIYRSSTVSPTILEVLVYWIASAMRRGGAYIPERTMEPIVTEELPPYQSTINARIADITRITQVLSVPGSVVSARARQGRNDESYDDPNIDLSSAFNGEGSLASYYSVQDNIDRAVQRWVARGRNAVYRRLDEDDFVPIRMDDMREDDVFNPTIGQGEWMV